MNPHGSSSLESDVEDISGEWRDHEHQAPALDLVAVKLLAEAGSMELAIKALQTAERYLQDSTAYEQAFASSCGYPDFPALVEGSTGIGPDGQHSMYLTELPNQNWRVWNPAMLAEAREFPSREVAEQFIQSGQCRSKAR